MVSNHKLGYYQINGINYILGINNLVSTTYQFLIKNIDITAYQIITKYMVSTKYFLKTCKDNRVKKYTWCNHILGMLSNEDPAFLVLLDFVMICYVLFYLFIFLFYFYVILCFN